MSADTTTPDGLVQYVVNNVIEAIKADPPKENSDLHKVHAIIDQKIRPHVSLLHMTALAMGRNWKSVTSEQQRQLVEEFTRMLYRTYAGPLALAKDKRITYKPFRGLPGEPEATVSVQVSDPEKTSGRPLTLVFHLEKLPDGWKFYDLEVEGTSLVTNYRTALTGWFTREGADGVIRSLKQQATR